MDLTRQMAPRLALATSTHPAGAAALPAHDGLPPGQRETITFCASKIAFNHGWLVQAEAPPSALLSRFKATIASSNSSPADIAFYFLHWLTDLAGAVPTPPDAPMTRTR